MSKTFFSVALLIVIIACINFTNLATARAIKRSKEVGLRKAIGASRMSLVTQFIGESALYTIFALALALLTVHLMLPYFNNLISKDLTVDYSNPAFLASIVLVTVLTAFMRRKLSLLFFFPL